MEKPQSGYESQMAYNCSRLGIIISNIDGWKLLAVDSHRNICQQF